MNNLRSGSSRIYLADSFQSPGSSELACAKKKVSVEHRTIQSCHGGVAENLAATQQRKASRIDGPVDLDQIVWTHVEVFLHGNTRKFGLFGYEHPARLDEPGFYVGEISRVTSKYRAGTVFRRVLRLRPRKMKLPRVTPEGKRSDARGAPSQSASEKDGRDATFLLRDAPESVRNERKKYLNRDVVGSKIPYQAEAQ